MAFTINGTTGINLATQPLTGQLPDGNAPSGSVIQIVSSQSTSSFSSSGSLTTVAEVSITPLSSSNKIFISWYTGMADNLANGNDFFIYVKRGGSGGTVLPVQNSTRTGYFWSASRNQIPMSGSYLDAPSATTATTYGIYIQSNTGSCTFGGITFNVMEITA